MSRARDRRELETCFFCGLFVGPSIGRHPNGQAECEDCAPPRAARDEANAARRVAVHCGICGDGSGGTWLVHPSAAPAKCDRCGNPHLIVKETTMASAPNELERVERQSRDLSAALGQPAPEPLATVAEAASYFRVEEQTIRRWIRSGRIRSATTPTGKPRIPASELRPRDAAEPQR